MLQPHIRPNMGSYRPTWACMGPALAHEQGETILESCTFWNMQCLIDSLQNLNAYANRLLLNIFRFLFGKICVGRRRMPPKSCQAEPWQPKMYGLWGQCSFMGPFPRLEASGPVFRKPYKEASFWDCVYLSWAEGGGLIHEVSCLFWYMVRNISNK